MSPHLVSEDHDAIVRLAAQRPSHTLRRVPHGIKGEEVVLPDLVVVSQVLQPRLTIDRSVHDIVWSSGQSYVQDRQCCKSQQWWPSGQSGVQDAVVSRIDRKKCAG